MDFKVFNDFASGRRAINKNSLISLISTGIFLRVKDVIWIFLPLGLYSPLGLFPLCRSFVHKKIMVSFYCQLCSDTLKKPSLPKHAPKCPSTAFTCIDCQQTFTALNDHQACVSEKEKYAGKCVNKVKKNVSVMEQIRAAKAKLNDSTTPQTTKPETTTPKVEQVVNSTTVSKKSTRKETLKNIQKILAKKSSITVAKLEEKLKKKGLGISSLTLSVVDGRICLE